MNKWIDSRNQMPPDGARVWVTGDNDANVYAAVFYKGERIDMGQECFYWRVEGFDHASISFWFWQPRENTPEPMKLGVRGGVYEANKAVWTFSGNTTPFEFDKMFWVYDEKLGVVLATLESLEEIPYRWGFPVFRLAAGKHLYGRRYYMPLLYPTKPA